MALRELQDTISVVVDDLPDNELTRANLMWPNAQPIDIYTIDASSTISIAMDSHFPIRPSRLIWRYGDEIGSDSVVSNLLGDKLQETMSDLRRTAGYAALQLSFNYTQRLALAELQLRSPSTPMLLRKGLHPIIEKLQIQVGDAVS